MKTAQLILTIATLTLFNGCFYFDEDNNTEKSCTTVTISFIGEDSTENADKAFEFAAHVQGGADAFVIVTHDMQHFRAELRAALKQLAATYDVSEVVLHTKPDPGKSVIIQVQQIAREETGVYRITEDDDYPFTRLFVEDLGWKK